MPEESPIKLKVERDILVQSFEKAKEFMRTQKKQIQTLEEEKQMILSDRQRLREEVRKSTVEIQRLTTELSETQKLNQSLQQSNDDLRNRNGLMSRSEQEQLEEEIRDVRDQNSKLQIQVNKSSVEAVDEAQKKQKEAEKKMEQVESKARDEKKRAELEIRKAKKEVKDRMESMKSIEYFWGMGYITVILFAIIQNGAFQNDFIDFFSIPFTWYVRFCEWLIYQPFTKSNIPRKGNTEKIYEIILKSTILYDCKQDYRNISHSPEIFYRFHTFHSVLYFFFRFTDFQLSTFLFVTGFGFYLLHLFLCFFLFLLCFIYRFNR